MNHLRLFLMMLVFAIIAQGKAQTTDAPAPAPQVRASHPAIGTTARATKGLLMISLEAKKQNYSVSETETRDVDIVSPKSVNIHPNGQKYYVNSLEGAKTVVYKAISPNIRAIPRRMPRCVRCWPSGVTRTLLRWIACSDNPV